MKAKVFTLRFDRASGIIDDAAFVKFFENRQLLSMSDHIVEFDREPILLLCVTYRDDAAFESNTSIFNMRREAPRNEDPRKTLDDNDCAFYDSLRLWRNKRAEASGAPGYIVFTNRQLGEIARRRPRNLAALSEIPGVGEARLAQHGADVLALIAELGRSADQRESLVKAEREMNHE